MSDRGALICGFWDAPGKLAGLAWDLGAAGGVLWRDGELAAASAEIDDRGDSVGLRLDAGGRSCAAELAVGTGEAQLGANGSGRAAGAAARCAATVSVGAGNGRTVKAPGQLTRFSQSPTDDGGLLRHLVVPAADGALLVVLASGASGRPHDEEAASAWLLDPDGGTTRFREALLSTQYDEGGLQTRAGLELWSEDDEAPPVRAAGTPLGRVPERRHGVAAALLRSSAEGVEGVGSYLIWRG